METRRETDLHTSTRGRFEEKGGREAVAVVSTPSALEQRDKGQTEALFTFAAAGAGAAVTDWFALLALPPLYIRISKPKLFVDACGGDDDSGADAFSAAAPGSLPPSFHCRCLATCLAASGSQGFGGHNGVVAFRPLEA